MYVEALVPGRVTHTPPAQLGPVPPHHPAPRREESSAEHDGGIPEDTTALHTACCENGTEPQHWASSPHPELPATGPVATTPHAKRPSVPSIVTPTLTVRFVISTSKLA